MSISSAINAARSGLQISSLRAETVATNVANAATPGYVRRSVSVSETLAGQQTTGVTSNGILQSSNEAVTGQRRLVASDLSQASVLSSAWQTVSNRLGDSFDGDGLFASLSAFDISLGVAATSPESVSAASSLLANIQDVANTFNDLSSMNADIRREADIEIGTGVSTVNAALTQIQDLNSKLAGIDRSGSQAAALRDERGRALDQISEYMSIQTVERDSGTIDVLTSEGVYLVAGRARQIDFSPASAFQANQTIASGHLSGMSVDGIDITPGASSFGAVSSGMFGALFQLRDQDIPAFGEQLDALAGDLLSRLSDDAIDPSKTPGEFGLFVDPSPTAGAGLAGRISVNASVDPAQGGLLSRLRDGVGATTPGPEGNATFLNAMRDAISSVNLVSTWSINGSFSTTDLAAHLSSVVGQTRISHESTLSSSSAQHTALTEAELEETGVDIDAQMQDLLLIEQSYAANARVIEVASQMLNRLMEL